MPSLALTRIGKRVLRHIGTCNTHGTYPATLRHLAFTSIVADADSDLRGKRLMLLRIYKFDR